MANKALITGITGQDGSYLAEYLLRKNYEVHGMVRRVATEDRKHRINRLTNILDRIVLHPASLENYGSIFQLIDNIRPNECYHLAAQSFVAESFDDPFSTLDININGTLYLLSALKQLLPKCRFYFAATSEMFGLAEKTPQNEKTPFHPRSPYGVSKVAGFDLTRNYRESYGMFACSGILFNHESPRRGHEFVTRKITNSVAKIHYGLQDKLRLGNLDAKRDWGYAGDYIKAMWLMLQNERPQDFVIATGETHTVSDFVKMAFDLVGLDFKKYVTIDKQFYRPAEVELLLGDNSKAKQVLGWEPKTTFKQLVAKMVEEDMKQVAKEVSH